VSFGSARPTVNADAPITMLYDPLAELAGDLATARWLLVAATIVLAGLFVEATALLRRSHLIVLMTAFLLVAVPGVTGWMFARFLGEQGWSGRPLTERVEPEYDWVDRSVGPGACVRGACATFWSSPKSRSRSCFWSAPGCSSGRWCSCTTCRWALTRATS
jgi:hypothetical protein